MAKKINIPLPSLPGSCKIIDTHCHLDMTAYDSDLVNVINNAALNGVSHIISIGIDLKSSEKAIQISESFKGVSTAVGFHPHNCKDLDEISYEKLELLADHPKVVAYGEIGLDYVKLYSPVHLQKLHFRRQVKLAKASKLPMILHDREAHEDMIEILRDEAPFRSGGVMHCFSGNMKLAEKVLELGFHISIPGIVTYNKADDMREVAKLIPLSSLLLETDGPYLAPVPKRGKRNEPSYVLHTAKKIAELRNMSLEDLAAKTTQNATTLFKLK